VLGYGAALAWGLAAGLLGYRFGVLPLHLESPRPEVMGVVGILLAVAAFPMHWRWGRSRPRDRARLGRLAVACGAAALVAGAALQVFPPLARLRLATEELPGFSVAIPREGRVTGSRADYRTGQIVKQGLGGLRAGVTIGWAAGDVLDDADAQEMNDSLALAFRSREHDIRPEAGVALPDGLRGRSWAARHDTVNVRLTFVACGGRRLAVITVSDLSGVDGLHRRMVATLRCRPDPAREALLDDIPVVFDVEGSWTREPSTPDMLLLRQADEDGDRLLGALSVGGAPARHLERVLLIGILGRIGSDLSIGYATEDRWSVHGRLGGSEVEGWARLQICPERGQTLALVWISWSSHDSKNGIRALHRARCRFPDEPRQRWPEPSDR
jgi:hypothetical protein